MATKRSMSREMESKHSWAVWGVAAEACAVDMAQEWYASGERAHRRQ